MSSSPRVGLFTGLIAALSLSCASNGPLYAADLAKPLVRAIEPSELSVVVGPGTVKMPDGKRVDLCETRLSFESPEIREVTITGTTPRDHADWYDAWDPWPGAQFDKAAAVHVENTINLSPDKDEQGTRILGHLYRAFIPDSLVVTTIDGTTTFRKDQDYVFNADWGQIANLDGRLGKAGESEIAAKAKYATDRLDLVQVDPSGKVSVKKGTAAMVCPALPEPDAGNAALAGVHIAAWRAAVNPFYDAVGGLKAATAFAISPHEIFMIEPAAPVQPINQSAVANSLKKLAKGRELKIAFLGASISVGAEAPAWWADMWTEKNLGFSSRVVTGLRKTFPKAIVTPIPAFQGATTAKYGLEIIDKTVKPAGADLVLIDFGGNDASGPVGKEPRNPPEQFKKDMRAIIQKAKQAGMEVMIVVGEASSPWTKNKAFERWPAYRQAMLELANEENVAAADIAAEMANLASHGIPPFSQLHNGLNHPGIVGHKVYADTILRFFPPVVASAALGADPGELKQPTTISDQWAWQKPPMPPLDKVMEKATANPYIYGVYAWAGEYLTYRDSIKKVGWRSYRCGGRGLEAMTDKAMQAFAEDDTEVMLCFGTAAQKLDATKQEDETFVRNYAEGIKTVLGRYGPDGAFFRENPSVPKHPIFNLEIWNEPNFQYLIPPDKRSQEESEAARAALYAKLLPAAYAAAKNCSKDVNVVGFGAGGAGAGDMRFIEAVNQFGPKVAGSYDILSTHPYVEPAPPEAYSIQPWGRYSIASSLEKIRANLASHGRPGIPIWYTEIGWPISKEDGGFYATTHPTISPELQAAYVCRTYAYALRLGVSRVHIMSVDDTDTFNSGFFLRDGTWRPCAYAVQTMTRLMPAPRLVGALSDGEDGYFAYRFASSADPKAAPVIMLWNVAGPKVVEVPLNILRATVIDMLGRSHEAVSENGHLHLEIGPLPTYVRLGGQ